MKRVLLYLALVVGFLMLTSCESMYLEEKPNQSMSVQSPLTRSSIVEKSELGDYKVDYQLLQKYLKVSGKSVRLMEITPLVVYNDTLAYCIQYDKGWEIVSGDKRCGPVMISSELGSYDPLDSDIQGLLDFINNMRDGGASNVAATWAFLAKGANINKSNALTRGGGSSEAYTVGMWRAIDTVFVSEVTEIPHIIQSRWSQSYPWNLFTPFIDNQKSSVGCSAVAAGQIIHHYRKNNSLGVEFPVSAIANNEHTIFSEAMDALRWSSMSLSMLDIMYCDQTALMLAYLGQEIMNLNYRIGETGILYEGVKDAFQWGRLEYQEINSYNYDVIERTLFANSPVCVYTDMRDIPDTNSHVYIIDRYKIEDTYYAVTCWWDPDYIVSEEEYYANDPRRFLETADGRDEKVFEEAKATQTYLGMLWGYAVNDYDNRFYLAKSFRAGGVDEAGPIPSYEHIYDTYWDTPIGVTGTVRALFYNFGDLNN